MMEEGEFVLCTAECRTDTALTDEQLIEAYRRDGDPGHLDGLVRRHLKRVRGLIWQLVLEDSLADDLTQEVFLRVVRHIDTFDGNAAFGTWLYRIAVNVVRTHWKKANQPTQSLIVTNGQALQEHAATTPPPHAQLDADDEIQVALSRLSPTLRAAVVLVSIQRFDAAEAAEMESCTVSTIYWRLHEARRQLRQHLETSHS